MDSRGRTRTTELPPRAVFQADNRSQNLRVPGSPQEPKRTRQLDANRLRTIKAVHTAIWGVLVACILAIPVLGGAEMYRQVLWLTGVVFVEALVLMLNGWRCPLAHAAARYTDDRSDNFDIYLPVWLARYNKLVFGSLFVAGEVIVVLRWRGWIG